LAFSLNQLTFFLTYFAALLVTIILASLAFYFIENPVNTFSNTYFQSKTIGDRNFAKSQKPSHPQKPIGYP